MIFIINLFHYLQTWMLRKKESFIGLSPDCQCPCLSQTKQSFETHPHNGRHEVLSNKDMLKKLTNTKISSTGCSIEDLADLINTQAQKIIDKIKQWQQATINNIKVEYFKTIICPDIKIDDKLIEGFSKMSTFQYEDLSCSEVSRVFLSVNKNLKEIEAELENKKSLALNKLKGDLISILNQTFQAFSLPEIIIEAGKKQAFLESEVKELKVNSTGPSSNSLSSSFSISSSGFSVNFQESSISQSQPTFIRILDNVDSDQELNSFLKTDEKIQKEKKSFKKATIQIFDQDDNQKKNVKKQEKKQEKSQQKKQKKKEQKEEKKEGKKYEKKQEIKFETKEGKKQNQSQKRQQVNPNSKSYVRKQEGKYYLRVGHLDQPVYRDDKATFNIKLKVVKILIFRLMKSNNKTFKKVKFVAGDETGVVVCYTDNSPELRKGAYVVLHDCQLHKFYDSYQITSTKCKIWKQNEVFTANTNMSISRFESLKNLTYSMQKNQPLWPSISALNNQNAPKNSKSQIIAELSDIIFESEDIMNCYLSDGTGTIYAVIHKKQCPPFKIGFVYYFKKVTLATQDQGKQKVFFLDLSSQNSPTELEGMSYDLKSES